MAASLQIPGQHNVENASAAIAACREYVTSQEIIKQGLHNFAGLPHRLKFVAEKNGVKYYDDSIATTPGSAIAAMRSFDAPKVLLLGGSDKGAEYDEVVAVAKQTGTKVLAIGQTGQRIYELAQASGVVAEREEGAMPEVVAHAARMAPPDSVVILSPASASFDQYKSYSDRGDQFIAGEEQTAPIVKNFAPKAVEMEGAAIAHVAWANKVPFVIIRSISDNADGGAPLSYPEFLPIAARNSCAVVAAMLAMD